MEIFLQRGLDSQFTDLPVGLFVDRRVESFFSDFPKNICCHLTKSHLELFPSQPTRGAYHDRHETRGGVRWTRQRQARNVMQGRSKDL